MLGSGWWLVHENCDKGCIAVPPLILGTEKIGDIKFTHCRLRKDEYPVVVGEGIEGIGGGAGLVDPSWADNRFVNGNAWRDIKKAVANLECGPQSVNIQVSLIPAGEIVGLPSDYGGNTRTKDFEDGLDGIPNKAQAIAELQVACNTWADIFNSVFSTANGYSNDLTLSFSILGDEQGSPPRADLSSVDLYPIPDGHDYSNVGDIRVGFLPMTDAGGLSFAAPACEEKINKVGGRGGEFVLNSDLPWRVSEDSPPAFSVESAIAPVDDTIRVFMGSPTEFLQVGQMILILDLEIDGKQQRGSAIITKIVTDQYIEVSAGVSKDAEIVMDRIYSGYGLAGTMAHEMGHGFGIPHCTVKSLMERGTKTPETQLIEMFNQPDYDTSKYPEADVYYSNSFAEDDEEVRKLLEEIYGAPQKSDACDSPCSCGSILWEWSEEDDDWLQSAEPGKCRPPCVPNPPRFTGEPGEFTTTCCKMPTCECEHGTSQWRYVDGEWVLVNEDCEETKNAAGEKVVYEPIPMPTHTPGDEDRTFIERCCQTLCEACGELVYEWNVSTQKWDLLDGECKDGCTEPELVTPEDPDLKNQLILICCKFEPTSPTLALMPQNATEIVPFWNF
jgi:hypothetical protein